MTMNEKNRKRGRWWERGRGREGRGREGDGGREGRKEGRKEEGREMVGENEGKREGRGREGVGGTISFSYSDLEVNQFIPDTDRFLQLKG